MEARPARVATTPPRSQPAELALHGARISPGLGMGRAWIFADPLERREESRRLDPREIEAELQRIREALSNVGADLQESARRVSENFDPGLADIFRAHQRM